MQTVLVTGANGFVGQPLCQALCQSGFKVRAAVRSVEAARTLPALWQTVITHGSVENTDWREHLDGIEAVVHLIGRTHVIRERAAEPIAEYQRVNVEGTRRLLEGCRAAGVRRFVFLSSIKAVGERSELAYDENTPCRPDNPYGTSKRAAEQLVLKFAEAHGLEAVVLRPPLIYGAGARGNLLRLMKAVRLGLPLPLGRTSGKRSLVYVRNVADAIRTCLTHPRAPGEIFHVADDVPLATRELILKLAHLQGVRARLVPVPIALLCLAGRVLRRTDEVDRLICPLTVSSAKIRERLDWRPRFTTDYGLQEMVETFATSAQNGTSPHRRPQCQATAIPGARTTGIHPSYETDAPRRERLQSRDLVACAEVRSE